MRFKRIAGALLLCIAFLGVIANPAAAQQYHTPTEQFIQQLNSKLLYIAVPITVLVEGILFYAVMKFRNNDDPSPTEENRRLEITWTVATALVLLFVGVASYGVMAQVTTPPSAEPQEDQVVVDVIAEKWVWNYEYPEENAAATNTMVIPVDQEIYLNVTSVDWLHAFHAPELGLKQDARPGKPIPLEFTPTEKGEYTLYCAEYCGAGHSKMLGTIKVVSQEEYQNWLAENQMSESGGNGGSSSNNSTTTAASGSLAPVAAN